MPLVALNNGERIVSTTLDMDSAREQPKGTYTCPGCEHAMHPKQIRATGTQFFSHYAKGTCAHGLGESPAHLHLKEIVHDIAVKQGWTADYEVRIDTPKGIAIIDVLLSHPTREKRKAVEIQLSRQTDAQYIQRSNTYAKQGIETLWLTRHAAPEWKGVTAVQLWADNAKQQPLDAYIHADLDTPILQATVGEVKQVPIAIDILIGMWLWDELTHHDKLELNPRAGYSPRGVIEVMTTTVHNVWIGEETRKQLATAHRDAKQRAAEKRNAKQREVDNRNIAEQRRLARDAKVAEMRKQRVADDIQAAVDKGKALQRAHRMAAPPSPWKDRIHTWLDAPIPDDIGETLDRLSIAYNAQQENP